MARRKDHTPEQLRILIRSSAEKLIYHQGLDGLTARALAKDIGYTPGTIYNFYKDMGTLIADINFETLGRLHDFCQERMEKLPAGFSKIKTLAYAYVDFAHDNRRAWETLFAAPHNGGKKIHVPKHYQERLFQLFGLLERTLQEGSGLGREKARSSARLLWACMHGITVLTLDGRLNLVGVEEPHEMIDELLQKHVGSVLV